MPRIDTYHDIVCNALDADGWTITHDPYPLKFGEQNLFIDIGMEMPLGIEKNGRKIAIEVKTFLGKSPMPELDRALGQYFLYRFLLEHREPERALYLAVPNDAYDAFLNTADARDFMAAFQIRLLTFDIDTERIVEWAG